MDCGCKGCEIAMLWSLKGMGVRNAGLLEFTLMRPLPRMREVKYKAAITEAFVSRNPCFLGLSQDR